jgi:uncharacterized caspase-like protein
MPFYSTELKGRNTQTMIVTQSLSTNLPNKIKLYTAAMPKQETQSIAYSNMGLFSYALADGLSGSADSNEDSQVSNSELANYVSMKVQEISETINKQRQIPNYL